MATTHCKRILIGLSVLAATTAYASQSPTPSRLAVYVDHFGEDQVGVSFAYDLRETLRGSRGYRLALSRPGVGISLRIVSVDDSCSRRGESSAISVTMTADNGTSAQFVTAWIYTVGNQRTADRAKELVAEVDKQVTDIRRSGQ